MKRDGWFWGMEKERFRIFKQWPIWRDLSRLEVRGVCAENTGIWERGFDESAPSWVREGTTSNCHVIIFMTFIHLVYIHSNITFGKDTLDQGFGVSNACVIDFAEKRQLDYEFQNLSSNNLILSSEYPAVLNMIWLNFLLKIV